MKIFSKRIIFLVSVGLISTSLLSNEIGLGSAVIAASPQNQKLSEFTDLSEDHWAHSAISSAVKQGYVGGYPDGTFRPEVDVSVAEFTQMIVKATGVTTGRDYSKWYLPAVDGAKEAGFITKNDYTTGNYNKKMTRTEMAKMAVLAVGETASSSNEFILKAVQLGLLSGVGKGKLDVNGTTTRAQSVAIIQRVQTVRSGGELSVDQEALAAAQDLVGARKDGFGQAIRTTNLPKNFADYQYILRDLPNEFYEMKYAGTSYKDFRVPAKTFGTQFLTEAKMGKSKDRIEAWFEYMFNLDYRTIDSKWVDGITSVVSSSDALEASLKKYVQWIKDNKVVTEGTVNAEMSSIVAYNGYYYMKVYYEYEIISANSTALKKGDKYYESLFNYMVEAHYGSGGLKVGKKMKVVSEVMIAPMRGSTWTQLNNFQLNAGATDLSENFMLVK